MREYLITGNVIETIYGERGIVVNNRVFYSSGWDFIDEIEYAIEKIYEIPVIDGKSWHLGIDGCDFLQLVWEKPTITEGEKEPDINDTVYAINVYENLGFTPCYYKRVMKTALDRGFVFKTRKEAVEKVKSLGW